MKLAEFKLAVDCAYEMLGSDVVVYVSQGGEITRCQGVLVSAGYEGECDQPLMVEVVS